MNRTIENSVVVITGASSGIGRATALRIAKMGGAVVLFSRQHEAVEEVARECEGLGGRVLAISGDVTDEEAVKNLARRAIETFEKIDVWINNAATTVFGRFEEIPPECFHRVIQTNFFGYVNGARTSIPHFRKQGSGTLINISSVIGLSSAPFLSAYSASKAAINALSSSLRMELSDIPDISVCTILPASIDTPLFQHGANYTGRAIKPLDPVYGAEEVVDAIIGCIRRPRAEVFAGNAGKALGMMERLAPRRLAEETVRKMVEENHFQKKPADISAGNLFEPRSSFNTISGGWRKEPPPHGEPSGALEGAHNGKAATGLFFLLSAIGLTTYYYRQRQQNTGKRLSKSRGWRPQKRHRGFHLMGR